MVKKKNTKLDRYIEIPVADLVECPWNYKENDDFIQSKLVNNLQKNGQIENLIVRELPQGKYEVVNGNHRYRALIELGVETAVCYNLGEIDENLAKRIAVETNETKFKANDSDLAQLIKSLEDNFNISSLQDTLPYTSKDYTNFDNLVLQQFNSGSVTIDESDLVDAVTLGTTKKTIKELYIVEVSCDSENEQEGLFNRLIEDGYKCRIVNK